MNKKKKSRLIFQPLQEANFCSSIKLSAISVAPRWGRGSRDSVCVCESEPIEPFTLCLGGNGKMTILQ